MLSQVRAFSSLSRVIRAPAPSVSLKNVSVADALSNNKEPVEKKKSIEEATLSLLENTVSKDKNRPLDASIQRFQKIHEEGDLYHPYDLDDNRYRENLHARRFKRNTPTEDPFDVLGLDPLKEYKNYRLLTHFVSDMGKILPREQTGVSAKNQRKLAKAIKRARAMGLMSATSNQVDFRI